MELKGFDTWLLNQADEYCASEDEEEEKKYNPFDEDYFYDVEHGN